MTEALFFVALMAALYFTVRFRETQALGAAAGAGVAACAATLTRYEGWFLIPFVALYFLLAPARDGSPRRCCSARSLPLGPLYWLAHNWYSPATLWTSIAAPTRRAPFKGGRLPRPPRLALAWMYYRTAVQLVPVPACR